MARGCRHPFPELGFVPFRPLNCLQWDRRKSYLVAPEGQPCSQPALAGENSTVALFWHFPPTNGTAKWQFHMSLGSQFAYQVAASDLLLNVNDHSPGPRAIWELRTPMPHWAESATYLDETNGDQFNNGSFRVGHQSRWIDTK
jgi:hypothetical protein